MQYENLNKGKVTRPCVTVDAVDTDEGAMLDAEIAVTLNDVMVKTGHGLFDGKANIGPQPTQCTDLQMYDQ